jgi:hypothetical protein
MGRITMGFDFGLENPNTHHKRRNRWLFQIPGISASGIGSFPPLKSARPNISFKEIEVQHINETIYYPGKPDWKPIVLTLYEPMTECEAPHPVFQWLQTAYDPKRGTYNPSCSGGENGPQALKMSLGILELYDGCGNVLESWYFENIWPQAVEFGELEMSSSDLVTCDVTIRYDRAYILEKSPGVSSDFQSNNVGNIA